MVKWKKMNKKMAGLLLGVMMLFTASTTAFAYVDESAEASKVETTQTDQSEIIYRHSVMWHCGQSRYRRYYYSSL